MEIASARSLFALAPAPAHPSLLHTSTIFMQTQPDVYYYFLYFTID